MDDFNPRDITSIKINGDNNVQLLGNRESHFQQYIYEQLVEQGVVNRIIGYTLAYGPWKQIHDNWFVQNGEHGMKWNNSLKEWVLQRKRPDFIFVKNRERNDSGGNLENLFAGLSVNENTPNEYVIWETKKSWLKNNKEFVSYYRYCVNREETLQPNEESVPRDDDDYDYDGINYDIVQSFTLDALKSRAEEQAKGYADLLSVVIPNPDGNIYYRPVVFVLNARRNRKIAEISFGESKMF